MTLGLKFLLCINGKNFDFKKNSIQILSIFSCNKCVVMKLMGTDRNYRTNTIIHC